MKCGGDEFPWERLTEVISKLLMIGMQPTEPSSTSRDNRLTRLENAIRAIFEPLKDVI
jgi:hypothetical protein